MTPDLRIGYAANRAPKETIVSARKPAIKIVATLTLVALTLPYSAAWAQTPAPSAPAQSPMLSPQADVIAFPVRSNDTLRVIVSGADELSGDFRVDDSAGTITVAKLGAVKIVGLAQADVEARITARIRERKLLKKPLVAVYLIGRKAREVVVNGAVAGQGVRVVKDGATLSEVIEAAAPLQTADLTRVIVTRGGVDITVNYKKFQGGEERGETVNPTLLDGDKVYVYSSVQSAGVVRVLGEVKDVTKTQTPITTGTTAGQMIQQAGGLTEFADRAAIVLVRGETRVPVPFDQILKGVPGSDPVLQDRDVLVVPRLERLKQFAVTGAVREAKNVVIAPGDPLTLTDAIGRAGGILEGGRQDKIEIYRRNPDGTMTKRVVNMTKGAEALQTVQDGDYVFVPYPNRRGNLDPFNAVGLLSGLSLIFQGFRR